MANPNAFVAFVRAIEPPSPTPASRPDQADRYFLVHFDTGQSVRLNAADPRANTLAELLEDARRDELPAFVDLDPETHAIKHLYFPYVAQVIGLETLDSGDVQVRLKSSVAPHVLVHSNPDFRDILSILKDAHANKIELAVTETREHQVIDARPL
jgi:hypothetical protein